MLDGQPYLTPQGMAGCALPGHMDVRGVDYQDTLHKPAEFAWFMIHALIARGLLPGITFQDKKELDAFIRLHADKVGGGGYAETFDNGTLIYKAKRSDGKDKKVIVCAGVGGHGLMISAGVGYLLALLALGYELPDEFSLEHCPNWPLPGEQVAKKDKAL
jgi:hypothetical protein